MTAYAVIVRERTTDPDALQGYRDRAPRAREAHPLTPLAFYGEHQTLEGEDAESVAILGFPSMAAARAWYHSSEYQAALPYRLRGSVSRVILVAGIDEAPAARRSPHPPEGRGLSMRSSRGRTT